MHHIHIKLTPHTKLTQPTARCVDTIYSTAFQAECTCCVTGCHLGLHLCWLQTSSLSNLRLKGCHNRRAKQSRRNRCANLQPTLADSSHNSAQLLLCHLRSSSLLHPQQRLISASSRTPSLVSVLQPRRVLQFLGMLLTLISTIWLDTVCVIMYLGGNQSLCCLTIVTAAPASFQACWQLLPKANAVLQIHCVLQCNA